MGNVLLLLLAVVRAAMNLAGIAEQNVAIEPGTVMKFWAPDRIISNKPPVVLLHGFFCDGIFTWIFQVLPLTRKYSVYVPDLIFFGGSITDQPDRSTSFQAECLAKGLMKLGVEKCTVVGFSYGGMVGFKMAELYPGLVDSLIVTGAVVQLTDSLSNALLKNVGFSNWSDFLMPATVEDLRRLVYMGSHNPIFRRLPNFCYRHFLRYASGAASYLEVAGSVAVYSLRFIQPLSCNQRFNYGIMFENRKERAELLEALVVPDDKFTPPNYSQKIHLLWGKLDSIFNWEAAICLLGKQLGDDGTWHYIEEAGHIAQLDRPILYNHHLKAILASIHS